jgi:hypothetical protein
MNQIEKDVTKMSGYIGETSSRLRTALEQVVSRKDLDNKI